MIATIAETESLSSVVALDNLVMVAIQMPDEWDAATLTFQASTDEQGPFTDMVNASGAAMEAQAAASQWVAFLPTDFCSVRYLKIRSGTAAAAIAQSANRVLRVVAITV